MSQSQSVRLFLLSHWDRLFCDGFQIKDNRQRCFPMVVNNRSRDAIIPMHRSSLVVEGAFVDRQAHFVNVSVHPNVLQ